MKFISHHKWLKKQVKIVGENQILFPKSDLIVTLNNVSSAIDKYNEELFLEDKIQLIQLIGLNLRNADKSYFNGWSEYLFKENPFVKAGHIFNNCKECYNTALAPSTLRKHYNERLVELHQINNNEVIHCLEKGKIIDPKVFSLLVEYFYLFTSIDLTGFPELIGIDRKQCKKCKLIKD